MGEGHEPYWREREQRRHTQQFFLPSSADRVCTKMKPCKLKSAALSEKRAPCHTVYSLNNACGTSPWFTVRVVVTVDRVDVTLKNFFAYLIFEIEEVPSFP